MGKQSKQSENPYGKVDSEIERVNQKYLIGLPVTLQRQGGSLYVQGTFPPKPGEIKPKQRRIALGKAHVDCLYDARLRSVEIGTQLMLGKWQWQEEGEEDLKTIADFIKLHRDRYLAKNGDSIDTQGYWRKDFGYPFEKLPPEKAPTVSLCKRIIEEYPPNTRSRLRYVKAYSQLLKLAGIDPIALSVLKGGYRADAVQPRDIPDLDTLIEWGGKVPPPWKFAYFLVCCFGLRSTEFHPQNCRIDDLYVHRDITVFSSKTKKWRFVPCIDDRLFDALSVPPNWHRKDERSPQQMSTDFENALDRAGCPFTKYDPRHHYAYLALLKGWDTALTARYMGHSVSVHTDVYMLCIDLAMSREIKKRH